jgi:hypothetical protein
MPEVQSGPTQNDSRFMRLRASALAASLLILGSVAAQAQTTTTVKITAPSIGTAVTSGPAVSAGYYPPGTPNFYVSPYAGLVNYNTATGTGTSVSLNCVDFFHDVSLGDVWTANVTNLGAANADNSLLANTRYGNTAGVSNYGTILTLYKQAAWLTLQYDADPGLNADKTRAIQSAIWTLFNNWDGTSANGPAYDAPGTGVVDSGWWVTQAGLVGNQLNDDALGSFSVLTDNTSPWAADSKQEFLIHTTPEPGTVVLMLTGIIALLVVVRRRRTGAAEIEMA